MIEPLRNWVVVEETEIKSTTAGGIYIGDAKESGSKPAKVVAIGPDVCEVNAKDEVYLRWDKAIAITHGGIKMAMIEDDNIVGIISKV